MSSTCIINAQCSLWDGIVTTAKVLHLSNTLNAEQFNVWQAIADLKKKCPKLFEKVFSLHYFRDNMHFHITLNIVLCDNSFYWQKAIFITFQLIWGWSLIVEDCTGVIIVYRHDNGTVTQRCRRTPHQVDPLPPQLTLYKADQLDTGRSTRHVIY